MLTFDSMNALFKEAYDPKKLEALAYTPKPKALATQAEIDAAFEQLSPTDFLKFCIEQDQLREELDKHYDYSPFYKQLYLGEWGTAEPSPKTVKKVTVKVGDHVVAKEEKAIGKIKTHFNGRFA